MGLKEQLNRRDFRLLLIGQTVSSLGDWMGTMALMYFVLELSGSTTAVGGVLVLRLLPSALGAPLAARVVTRWRRRSVMLVSDMVRVGMALALPLLPWLWWVYFWAFAIEMVGLCFLPARDAAIPFLISEHERRSRGENGPADETGGEDDGEDDGEVHDTRTLELANGITMATSYGMIPFGAGAFGLILWLMNQAGWEGHWRYVVVFWLDALTYLGSYFAVRAIRDLGPARWEQRAAEREEREAVEREVPATRFIDAMRLRVVRGVLPGVAVVALGLGALFSLGVVFVRNVLDTGPVGFGALVALFGVGAVTGLAILRRGRDWNLLTQVRVSVAVQGLVVAAMGALGSVAWAFVGAVLFGASATSALIGGITYLQEGLSGVRRNLALTAFHAVLRFGLALAALLAGAAADLLGGWDPTPLGRAPSQVVLMGAGLITFAGVFLIRPAAGSRPDGDAPAHK